MEKLSSWPILTILLSMLASIDVISGISVSLVNTAILVEEGDQFKLQVKLDGAITSTVYVIVTIKDLPATDTNFIGSSQVGSFRPGGPTTISVTFTTNNDSIPEVEQTFVFQLSVAGQSGVTVGKPDKAVVTINANDNAYGVFSFKDKPPVYVDEDAVTSVVYLTVGRDEGTFKDVTVSYTVSGKTSEAASGMDVTPKSGVIVFKERETQVFLELQIRADNIPENDEEFIVTLTSASLDAKVSDVPQTLIIRANDAPLRFSQAEYRFDESKANSTGSRTVSVTVFRGIDSNGKKVGSSNKIASVDYGVISKTAVNGLDFQLSDGQVVFLAGVTEGKINIVIKDDDSPEVEEYFEIELKKYQGDVITSQPMKTRVIINANDNTNGVLTFLSTGTSSSPPFAQISEDTGSKVAQYTVRRTAGTFGTVTVRWVLERNDSLQGDVKSDVAEADGFLIFTQGQDEQKIKITVKDDKVAEPTEQFTVRLLPDSVTGGAKVEGILHGMLLIEDSDNYYGIVEFGLDMDQKINISTNPRHLQLMLKRNGQNEGLLITNLTVTYTGTPGTNQVVIKDSEIKAEFSSGQASRVVKIPLLQSAFLQVGGKFTATLTGVELQTAPVLGQFNTPMLGDKKQVDVPVTIAEANGEIGFESTATVTADEPSSTPYQVMLKLTREGTSGQASIKWGILGSSSITSGDTGPTSGTVVMDAGKSVATIIVQVMPDDIPELDEEFTVTLTSVTPADTQRLKASASKVKVIIRENDNPGGTFVFSSVMKDKYVMEEGGAAIDVIVERTGGSFLTRYVQYSIEPDGEKEFYGANNVLKFDPGVQFRNSTLLAIKDNIPEKLESFTLILQSYSNVSVAIGARASIVVDIMANDDPFGVVQFPSSPTQYFLDEGKVGDKRALTIEVQRNRGTFGSVLVHWRILPGDGLDVVPTAGTITIGNGQNAGSLRLESVPDEIPEKDETFIVQLWKVDGGAVIGPNNNTAVTIKQNDNPVYIVAIMLGYETVLYPKEGVDCPHTRHKRAGQPVAPIVNVKEPSMLTVRIRREGDGKDKASIKVRTLDGSASVSDGDYRAIIAQTLTFVVGEMEKVITVEILDDTLPEDTEMFYLQMYDIQGNLVFTKMPNATINIEPNDEAYGVFKFKPPYLKTVEEGSQVAFEVGRDKGKFGVVEVYWKLLDYQNNLQEIFDGGDFLKANGSIAFEENDLAKSIILSPRLDGEPEKNKIYRLLLSEVKVVQGSQEKGLAKLSTSNIFVDVTIVASDDPYGQFAFSQSTKALTIVEDYVSGQESKSRASLTIERRQGNFRTVEVSWEIFSTNGQNLPKVYDFLLLADIPNHVVKDPSKRRPGTGTYVIDLTSAINSYITVPRQYHPTFDEVTDSAGISIAAWVQPFSNLNGYIIAKTTDSGTRFFYTVKLVTGAGGTILLFGYSQTGKSTNQELSVTASKNIQDGAWHLVVVTVGGGVVRFYLDAVLIDDKTIGSQPLIDGTGALYVGAIAPGKEKFIGSMQDVRFFCGRLLDNQITELYNTPSRRDVVPISGYLSFGEGQTTHTITVQSVQDAESEPNEVFYVKLLTPKNGATLSKTDAMATLTVEKSDNANGMFRFKVPCTPSTAVYENVTVSCTVERLKGTEGSVDVTWSVLQVSPGGAETEAVGDFNTTRGILTFYPKENSKVFNLKVTDDSLPELKEEFKIRLVSVTTGDGVAGSTDTSGASIDPSASVSKFAINENDFPYGMFQFSVSTTPPASNVIITPSTHKPEVKVPEESGVISVMVVRAQGSQGVVSVEWRTRDGTAQNPKDYKAGVGRLTFGHGRKYEFLTINIVDNKIPEDRKTFFIDLLNPSGGATLGVASTITVVIDHSDGAFGIFQFGELSLNLQTEETGDSGFNSVVLQVMRLQGSLGTSTVAWQVLGSTQNDIVDSNGTISVGNGVSQAMLDIKVRGDTVPELDELYQIKLTSVDRGELGDSSKIVANLTVLANDNPYGLFVISSKQRPVIVTEQFRNVTITITRKHGTFGKVQVGYKTLKPSDKPSFIPASVFRATENDFRASDGTVTFSEGQVEGIFPIMIMDDDEPENDESLFVQLTSVSVIIPAQQRTVSGSPAIGLPSESYAQIIIDSNDNAHGALELYPVSVSVEESSGIPDVNVTRRGGVFGEVSVKFRVVNGTALQFLDFEVLSDTVVLADGERSKALPIVIINDIVPELSETFYIELINQVTGDAVLGSKTYSVISILPSDDPSGAFGFAVNGKTVEEPENGKSQTVNITVVRTGGTMGVVTVDWQATFSGKEPVQDISPTKGQLHFVSNEASHDIVLSILPDDKPEAQEDITIKLTKTSNGGRVGVKDTFTLTIVPNDDPHGTLEFSQPAFTVEERSTSTVQYIKLNRTGGVFGILRIYYSTEQIDILKLATSGGGNVLKYFDAPVEGSRGTPGSDVDVSKADDPLQVCSNNCLKMDACLAFEVFVSGNLSKCVWFITPASQPLVTKMGYVYYSKHQVKMQELLRLRATAGQDYGVVTNGYIIINDLVNEGAVPLTILADNVPELGEQFEVVLTRVEVVSLGGSNKYPPKIGSLKRTTVTIQKNDNAYGKFTILSDSPAASQNGHFLPVEEKQQLAVDLIIERLGGNMGTVSVEWFINKTLSTATYKSDYQADGATVQFAPGETRKLVTVTVLDDNIPEPNKTVMVQLRNTLGGAEISADAKVNIVILENDNVAGVLGFDKTSVLAREGDEVTIKVNRKNSAKGTVYLSWKIQGKNGLDPGTGFKVHRGDFVFPPDVTTKELKLSVLKDTKPETNEEYQIYLYNITTDGIGPTGAAKIDPQFESVSVTIQGSNDPHGIIQFSPSSQNLRILEDNTAFSLQIDRKFGAIGKVRVQYEITNGSVSQTNEELQQAEADVDFTAVRGYIDIDNGVSSAAIQVQITDDDIPEVDEVFIVTLTGVTLLGDTANTVLPKLAATGIKAQIIIDANDGTKGVIKFAKDSTLVVVDEITKNISLTVFRDKGTFGEVSVFYYAQSIVDGTTQGIDYMITPQELFFAKNEANKMIMVEIFNDEVPEPDESFQIILSNPTNGLMLGTPSRATVTILANDGSSGIVSFDSDASVTIEESGGGNSTTNIARLKVVRGPGIYGVVNVPFEIIPEFPDNSNDLSPTKGYATFQDKQNSVMIELKAFDDSDPEQIERFTVRLKSPDNKATLGRYTERMVIINPNDSPSGLLQIYVRGNRNKSISVDENIGMLKFDIERTQGSDGTVTVDVATRPDTAVVKSDLSKVTLAPYQAIPTTQVQGWHDYTVGGTQYLVMLTNFRVGELKSTVGSNGSVEPVNVDRLYQSTLFKWRGQLVPVQTLETDAASFASSFTIGTTKYFVICNYGNIRRHKVNSRIYKVNKDGSIVVLQDLQTEGALMVKFFSHGGQSYIVFANSIDNNGHSLVNVNVYKWEESTKMFTTSPWQSLSNLGAYAIEVFEIEGVKYMAVANNYNSEKKTYTVDSVVYKFGADHKFSEHQRIKTEGAVDMAYLQIRSLHLLVFGNNRGDTISSPQTSTVHRWDSTAQMFFRTLDITTNRVESLTSFLGPDDNGYLMVANGIGNSEIYQWDIQNQKFAKAWTGSPALQIYPWVISQTSGPLTLTVVANKDPTATATLYQLIKVKDSDFAPRTVTMTFEPGQRALQTSIMILQDNEPEDTETFFVSLTRPTGGANIGPQNTIAVKILSNDNAHGIIEIAADSLEVRVQEIEGRDNNVQINVIRRHGFFGRVVVKWVATGDQNGLNDITPLQGTVELASGQSVATITLTVLNDNLAELPEVTFITLTEMLESGTTLPGRGAKIGPNNQAKMIVQANDSPYGVVLWEKGVVNVAEPNNTDYTLVVYIIRQQGMKGNLQVSYKTGLDTGQLSGLQAVSGEDYVYKQGVVVMQENATRVPVEVSIKHDSNPEGDETFILNITSVTLMGSKPPAGAEPSVRVPGNIITVTINENDNARGIIQFNVTTNIEGRIDTYEEFGKNTTIKLQVSRSIGDLGAVTVTWQADPREATILDFSPSSGTIRLEDGQVHADIIIHILDDTVAEEMETFDVKLISKSGGSAFGPIKSVRVAILKNDSPNGLFRFRKSEVRVKESRKADDPEGQVSLVIERLQGADGVVNVRWRLSAEAVHDFDPPQSGTILFSQGEKTKTIVLQTKQDKVLEGEEKFRVSLIAADNNADISHTQGDATVIISPDPGSSGTISILPQYRKVFIGEPGESDPSYNGKVKVQITRGLGIYGSIGVAWSVTPRETSAFLQVEGTLQFADLQQTAFITLQSQDDTKPELRRVYTLQINSATGGAVISSVAGEFTSDVVFVASDYPHGLFEFILPERQIVKEDVFSLTIPVFRQAGLDSQVLVSYATSPSTATNFEDFFPNAGTLVFQHGERQQTIDLRIIQDDLPEGPETFFVNLTSARLLTTNKNNYTTVGGLQLDMPPAIGSVKVKIIVIDKNDDAEGTIEFDKKAVELQVSEDIGTAKILVVRKGGNYGKQTLRFSTQNETAREGIDYSVPNHEVVFEQGQMSSTINITVHDDTEMEPSEIFHIKLESIVGGAKLGSLTHSSIIIRKSDYPNGKFGFKGQLEISVPNPDRQIKQTLTIERTGGLTGKQQVFWRILGPNNPGNVLRETNDISYSENGPETTEGQLTWEDGKGGEKSFTLNIKPYSSWEIQKTFIVEIHKVQGFPLSSDDGEIGPTTGKLSLSVEKFGDPNGIVRFVGVATSDRMVDEPQGSATLELRFPISRRADTGTVGSIQIHWEIHGTMDDTPDFQPRNGSMVIGDGHRDGAIVINVLPDNVPELTEKFTMVLKSVDGGAEIDLQYNTSVFRIRMNDNPNGLFGIVPQHQTVVVDTADLRRSVQLNFTRYEGTFGSVILTFSIKYDIPQSGVLLSKSGGTVEFSKGEDKKIVQIAIAGDGFLEVDSTFTVTLTSVSPPLLFKQGETEAKVKVPAAAANSEVGFAAELASVDEETSTATLALTRLGTYGTIGVPWRSGFADGDLPKGFQSGEINPSSGTLTIPNGIQSKNFTVQLLAKPDKAELFALHLTAVPTTSVPGGAKLNQNRRLIKIEPNGVVRFASNSTSPTVTELEGKIHLMVQRVYGSEGKLEVIYRSETVTAIKKVDFITMETNSVLLEPGQTSGLIMIQVLQDNTPEEEETFHVNLTRVEKYPTEITPRISPRLSSLYTDSVVHIEESNDPYGILHMEPEEVSVGEEYKKVNVSVRRTGGVFGTVSVLVRTVGGGESWTNQIVPTSAGSSNDTIRGILGNRQSYNVATGGQDYDVLDTKVTFLQGQITKTVQVTILADTNSEPDETIIVYLTQPVGGARIAEGSPDAGKKGFSVITILQNDLSNGIVGFSDSSKSAVVNEDSTNEVTLKLTRTNAFYGQIEVSWVAKLKEDSTAAEDTVLAGQLEKTAGIALCAAREASCSFTVTVKKDEIPEELHTFIVKLVSVRRDAQLDQSSLVSTITVEASDYVRGLIQFTPDSRLLTIAKTSRTTKLKVERIKGRGYKVEIGYQTMQMTRQVTAHGVTINPALVNEDFSPVNKIMTFEPDRLDVETIEISLTPAIASSNPLPKQFYVQLKNPSNGASIHPDQAYSRAAVRIVEDTNLPIWIAIGEQEKGSLKNDSSLLRTLAHIDTIAKNTMDYTEVLLTENILKDIIDEGLRRKLPTEISNQLMNVMCNLMNPNKVDSTRGHASFATLMEKLAYVTLTGTSCPTPSPPDLLSRQCVYAKLSAGRWPLEKIRRYKYQAQRQDTFTVPDKIPNPPIPVDNDCLDFHMIEYTSEQWFMKSNDKELLSNKVIAFGIKGRKSSYSDSAASFRIHTPDRRIATRRAQCVYYDFALSDWVSPTGVCTVNNNLDLALDDYVDCSCKHLTHYAVKATAMEAGLVGYSVWFFVASFICMICMALAILAHHLCSTLNAMFSANLLIHMCFACFATQLCYIVAAYLSPSEILVSNLNQDNYRCIVMGIFLHYFFLTQFTWILAQAINFWKILVLNDEHTDRKYVMFFLIGWGLPVVILAIFYVVTFNLYKYVYDDAVDFIYGDVNNNGEICFIRNAYAGLGGVILPVLLMLLGVGVVFVKAFQVTPQWQAYDDIYRGRYNINEIRTLLCFWGVITLTWLWGGLHMAYGQMWMLIMFCIFNIIQGLLALVLYTILRNPCVQQCFGPAKQQQYSLSTDGTAIPVAMPADDLRHHMANVEIGSLKGSRASLLNESWERDSVPSKSTMKVKRTLPSSGNIYVTPPVLVQSIDGEHPDKDFNDLLFALKTDGSYTASDNNSVASDKMSEISSKVDKYEMRRISIADTHL